ncbi:sulfurtransferase TusA family protein [Candidatus Methylomirabilis sp.]|uniref:Sulfurtransferase TusA family protein n=1 Tax=Candidatus Methylomirabilis tolerans TaxID=3123416 RepID=A0AAJ1AH88_9BACT|nr:sulfurtransferase TusA family protein [Candidatus Methylomirabilis sp.]
MSGAPEQITESLDLKGEVCPYTFVKTKLALEELQRDQVLRVIVDNPGSAANVPRSLTSEGHIIVDVAKLNDTDWAITVKKG